MFKRLLICLMPFVLAACSSTSQQWQQEGSKEAIYQKTNNHTQLVELYKQKLQQSDEQEVRENLAKSYLALGDAESALFYIKPLTDQAQPSIETLLIQAQAFGELAQYSAAINSAKAALELDSKNAEAENLLGTFYGYNYQYDLARRYFERSREHFFDGATVNNNLAVLDIAEGQYKQAIQRLLPLYKNGQADEQVMANLTLSMAKEGQYEFVKQVLSEKYSNHQIDNIYRALRSYDPLKAQQQVQVLSGANRES
ncbi:tetratricopeptide repeat protein [Vibrio rotiferianus]|uniref:tetratricopeptide repeat protein n=1 Tax=Vibrio rotiferianus TaxID=190895 RepID=UPI00390A6C65